MTSETSPRTEPSNNTFRNVAMTAAVAVGALGASAPGLPPLPNQRPAPAVATIDNQPGLSSTTETSTPSNELVNEIEDSSSYPIRTPWEEDFQTSPELKEEIRSAIDSCFKMINQNQAEGALLTGIEIGGLSSGEDNVTNPGDPMANLGKPSKYNKGLADRRGLPGLQTAKEEAPSFGIHPDIIHFSEGQEVEPTAEELSQIAGYAHLLGLDPLQLMQQYNRDIQGGLQPLMDNLFEGNRGIICTASYTMLAAPSESTKIVTVPLENGKNWQIEAPNDILIQPLLYIAYLLSNTPEKAPAKESQSSLRAPKEIGSAQAGHFQQHQQIKQPNIKTNFHNTGQRGHRSNHVRPSGSTTFNK